MIAGALLFVLQLAAGDVDPAVDDWVCIAGEDGWICGRGADRPELVDSSEPAAESDDPAGTEPVAEIIPLPNANVAVRARPGSPLLLGTMNEPSAPPAAPDAAVAGTPVSGGYALLLASLASVDDLLGFVDDFEVSKDQAARVPVVQNGILRHLLIYGRYDTPQQAVEAAGQLPGVLRSMRPDLVTLADFAAEPVPLGDPAPSPAAEDTTTAQPAVSTETESAADLRTPAIEADSAERVVNAPSTEPDPPEPDGTAETTGLATRPAEQISTEIADTVNEATSAVDPTAPPVVDDAPATAAALPVANAFPVSEQTTTTDQPDAQAREVVRTGSARSDPLGYAAEASQTRSDQPEPATTQTSRSTVSSSPAITLPTSGGTVAPRESGSPESRSPARNPGSSVGFREREGRYTIQLASVDDQAAAVRYLSSVPALDATRTYAVPAEGRVLILFDRFESFSAAQSQLARLEFVPGTPWVRRANFLGN